MKDGTKTFTTICWKYIAISYVLGIFIFRIKYMIFDFFMNIYGFPYV